MYVAESAIPHSIAEGFGALDQRAVPSLLHAYLVLRAACQLDLEGHGSALCADPSPRVGVQTCDSYSANRHTLRTLRTRFLFMNGRWIDSVCATIVSGIFYGASRWDSSSFARRTAYTAEPN